MNLELDYLLNGDLIKIARELKVSYQKVRDVKRGSTKDNIIEFTLIKLNKARKSEAETISEVTVDKIINDKT